MPRTNIDYSNTMIYKLVCNDLNVKDCYVGHTTNFKNRKHNHKNTCNNPNVECHNMPVHKCIRSNGGWNNWNMILVEQFECSNKMEAEQKEREIIEQLKPTLNKSSPYRTPEERKQYKQQWHNEHREQDLERSRNWYLTNKDVLNEQRKVKTVCECGTECRKCDYSRHLKSQRHREYVKLLDLKKLLK